jgi:peptide/histidine transporter 3/4
MSSGILVSLLVLTYIQDNLSWSLGFGIPCIMMICALIIFLLGSKKYRYSVKREGNNALLRIARVFVAAFRNWRFTPSSIASEEEGRGTVPHQSYEQFK